MTAQNGHSPGTSTPQPRIVIIGAGPTGLGAGFRLKELGYSNFRIFEKNGFLGGLAHSFTDPAGFTWDIGGHVMFSHYDYYDRIFARLMGDEFTLNDRESWVRIMDRWVPYPFQNNIRHLPAPVAYECLSGLIKAQSGRGRHKSPAQAANFAEFNDAVFGEGIVKHFMRPYNFKVWAHSPEMLNKEWVGERVAVIDYERALRNVVLGLDDFGWGPNNRFKFPLKGGTGEFYRRFGPVLEGHYELNKSVTAINVDTRTVTFADGSTEPYDRLVTAMPLDILCRDVLCGRVPAEIRAAAARLRHSSGYMVGIGIRRPCPSTKSWMYFPDDNCPFYRATYLSNYSPHMTPEPYVTGPDGRRNGRFYSLLCETSASEFKPVAESTIVEDTVQGLVNAGLLSREEVGDIVSRWLYKADYSYPVPTVQRDEILSEVIPWLEAREIYSRGRFGMWKYEVSNTDHTLMQGVELVDRLVQGVPEKTIGVVYRITEDGRYAAVHERAAAAGSGEKRPVPVVVVSGGSVALPRP